MATRYKILTEANIATNSTLALKAPLTSPALVTPNLGTPSAGTLTSCTGLPAAGVVGTAAVLGGNTFTGKNVTAGSSEVGKTYAPATGNQTVALDGALNNVHLVNCHANGSALTFTVANITNSQAFIVIIKQGASTASTITAWFNTVSWCGGTAPTLSTGLGKTDTFGFIRSGADTYTGYVVGQNA
jgi:hypothetical protein